MGNCQTLWALKLVLFLASCTWAGRIWFIITSHETRVIKSLMASQLVHCSTYEFYWGLRAMGGMHAWRQYEYSKSVYDILWTVKNLSYSWKLDGVMEVIKGLWPIETSRYCRNRKHIWLIAGQTTAITFYKYWYHFAMGIYIYIYIQSS